MPITELLIENMSSDFIHTTQHLKTCSLSRSLSLFYFSLHSFPLIRLLHSLSSSTNCYTIQMNVCNVLCYYYHSFSVYHSLTVYATVIPLSVLSLLCILVLLCLLHSLLLYNVSVASLQYISVCRDLFGMFFIHLHSVHHCAMVCVF